MGSTADQLRADVLLITAISSETKALKAAARELGLGWEKRVGQDTEYRHLGMMQGVQVAALELRSMGSFSETGSAFTCHRAMVESGATTVLAVGIAFGISEDWQRVGDLLIAESLHLYDEGYVVDDATTGYRYTYKPSATVPASRRWVMRFRRSAKSTGGPHHVGKLLAGGARIESRAFREHLRERVTDEGAMVVGGEMEAAGIAAACAAAKAEWVVVKAVSDFATKESRERIADTRDTAASRAAKFTLDTLLAPWETDGDDDGQQVL